MLIVLRFFCFWPFKGYYSNPGDISGCSWTSVPESTYCCGVSHVCSFFVKYAKGSRLCNANPSRDSYGAMSTADTGPEFVGDYQWRRHTIDTRSFWTFLFRSLPSQESPHTQVVAGIVRGAHSVAIWRNNESTAQCNDFL